MRNNDLFKEELFEQDKLLLLEDLMKLDVRKLSQKDRVYIRATRTKMGEQGVLFLSYDVLIHTYYLEAFSLIGFLIERYGSTRFASFCRHLRDGKELENTLNRKFLLRMLVIKSFS